MSRRPIAEKIRQRWVAGEDPAKLEKEAMEPASRPRRPTSTWAPAVPARCLKRMKACSN